MNSATPTDTGRVQSLDTLLERSQATDVFKSAVREFAAGRPHALIGVSRRQPDVKVLRTIAKLLDMYPDHPIERVDIAGASGCSDYVGTLAVQPGDLQIVFDWNCAWKARQMGWTTFLILPHQIRAAQECDYQCFREFREMTEEEIAARD